MKNILKNKLVKAGILATALVSGSAFAEVDPGVTAATAQFTSFFTDNANAIGAAFLGAAFVAIVWKWLKGMSFS